MPQIERDWKKLCLKLKNRLICNQLQINRFFFVCMTITWHDGNKSVFISICRNFLPVTEVWILRANLEKRCFAHLCGLIKLTHRNLSATDAAFCKSWRDREFALRNGTLIKVQLDEIKIGLILRLLWLYTFNIYSVQPLLLRCDREVLRYGNNQGRCASSGSFSFDCLTCDAWQFTY